MRFAGQKAGVQSGCRLQQRYSISQILQTSSSHRIQHHRIQSRLDEGGLIRSVALALVDLSFSGFKLPGYLPRIIISIFFLSTATMGNERRRF